MAAGRLGQRRRGGLEPTDFKPCPYHPGNFETLEGKVVGKHDGAAYYTIGQRKGLKIGGPGEAWFVVNKDLKRNVVFVEQGADHPALYAKGLIAKQSTFIKGEFSKTIPFHCQAKIRYRQKEEPCTIEAIDTDSIKVVFQSPQRAVTPRQSIVFYDGAVCLGGALIEKPFM